MSGMIKTRATMGTTIATIFPGDSPDCGAGIGDEEAEAVGVTDTEGAMVGVLDVNVGAFVRVSARMGMTVAESILSEFRDPITADIGISGISCGLCGDRFRIAMVTVGITICWLQIRNQQLLYKCRELDKTHSASR